MPFPVSHDRVLAVEAKLGRCLPAQYSARVVRDNGGEIRALGDNWRLHPVWDPSTKKTIKRTAFDLIKETESATRCYGFPPDALALASDDYGNYLISRSTDDTIEFWDHETGKCQPVEVIW